MAMQVHVVDGTYELFRQFFARPSHQNGEGLEVGAARAVVRNTLAMLEEGVARLAAATKRYLESNT